MTSATTGSHNHAVGDSSWNALTTGQYNVGLGHYTAGACTTPIFCVAIGHGTMTHSTTGNNNTAMGGQALYYNTSGGDNTAIGRFALGGSSANSHNNNTAVGSHAGGNITTGIENVFVGSYSGNSSPVTQGGSYNTLIGRLTKGSGSNAGFETVIGYNGTGKGQNTGFLAASAGVYQGNNSSSWSTTSDERLKKSIVDNNEGLSIIDQIRVRNFEYRTADEITELQPSDVVEISGTQIGVIAQELEAVAPRCVKTQSTGVKSVDTDELFWHMLNSIQELSAKVAELEAKGD